MIHKIVKLTLNLLLVLATSFAGNSAKAQSRINILAAGNINSYRSISSIDSIVFNPLLTYGTLTDIDGNIYKTIIIGKQTWMAENLKTTHFNDKTKIPNEKNGLAWPALTTSAYCWYNNDSIAYKATYGALYNWKAVNSGKLAPVGWHVSTEGEWAALTNYLIANGYNFDGSTVNQKYAKSLASAAGWPPSTSPGSVGRTDYPEKRNATGFTAMPGGMLNSSGTFSYIANFGFWWTSSEQSDKLAWSEYMFTNYITVIPGNDMKSCGFSVRCVKDSVSTTDVKLIDKKAGNNLTIYPNPVGNELHINYEASDTENIKLEILDLQGKIVKQQIHKSESGANQATISVAKFPSGLYLFRLKTGKTTETIKFYKH